MKSSKHFQAASVSIALILAAEGVAVDITDSLTIDTSSPFNGENVSIRDGEEGAVTVSIIEGGSVEGFTIEGSSALTLAGGEITFLSTASGNSTLSIQSGSFDCTATACDIIDYDALLTIQENARVDFRGGSLNGLVRLEDVASAHFWGTDLMLSAFDSSTIEVTGKYVSGNEFGVLFHRIDGDQKIVLHNIPEPSTVYIAALCICGMVVLAKKHGKKSRTF